MFLVCAVARNHVVEAHGSCSANCKEQGNYFCSDSKRDMEDFYDNSVNPPKRISLNRKQLMRALKECDRDADISGSFVHWEGWDDIFKVQE